MKWSLYLTKLSRTFFQIIFLTKQLLVMTKIHLDKNIKQLIQEKNNTYKSYILSDKSPQIFVRVKSLQNQLKYSIEGNKKIIICVYPKN